MFYRPLLLVLALLAAWIAADLLIVRKHSLRNFDPQAVAQLESDMWRSYYEGRQLRLFLQLSKLMREQFHAPFWRSFVMAYQAATAAAVFQDGQKREQYAAALPHLERYFTQINSLSTDTFDVQLVARQELEWWIIRREPQYKPADWEAILALICEAMYALPPEDFATYARLRVQAMVLRDRLGAEITASDWSMITGLLQQAWEALHVAVNQDQTNEN